MAAELGGSQMKMSLSLGLSADCSDGTKRQQYPHTHSDTSACSLSTRITKTEDLLFFLI